MKIGINGRFLQHPYTGIGQYTLQLLREFSRNESRYDMEYLIVVPNQACLDLLQREKIDLKVVVVPEKTWLTKSMAKHWWEQVQVPHAFREHRVDLIWLPYPCVRWFGGRSVPTVVTVHDTIPWTREEYRPGVLSSLAHAMGRHSTARANHIITVSKTSARDISRVCDVAEKNITIIENGVAEVFHRPVSPEYIAAVLRRFSLRERGFFLYVGGYDPRKRVDELIESYRKYGEMHAKRENRPCPYPLVLVGSLTARPTSSNVSIVTTGFLDDLDLAALYQSARGFVHLSAAEGFNIPLAQAMISHLPLLLSDTEIHREITGAGATYVQADDECAMMSGWDKLVRSDGANDAADADMREKFSERFSWKRSATAHLDVFTHISP